MDSILKIVAVAVYIAALSASVLKTLRIRNCENEEWYVLAALLMAFFLVCRLSEAVLPRALAGAAFVGYSVYALANFLRKRASYELNNAPATMEEELVALVDAFANEAALENASIQLGRKRPYRLVVRGLSHKATLPLLRTLNKAIRAHGKLSISSLVELLFLLLLGGALYVWIVGICLTGLLR